MTDSIFSQETLELAHFGKKGMHWGVRKNGTAVSDKKLTRMNKAADKGDARIAKYGSAKAANINTIGKAAAVTLLAHSANKLVSSIAPNNPTLQLGVAAVGNIAATSAQIIAAKNVGQTISSKRRTTTS